MKWKRRGICSGKILMQVSSTPEVLDFLDFLDFFFLLLLEAYRDVTVCCFIIDFAIILSYRSLFIDVCCLSARYCTVLSGTWMSSWRTTRATRQYRVYIFSAANSV